MSQHLIRCIVNPLLALSGGLSLVSGGYLLFHIKSRVIAVTHEVGSLVFVALCLVHLALNAKPLLKTLGGRRIAWGMLAVLLMTGAGMAFSDITPRPQHGARHTMQR